MAEGTLYCLEARRRYRLVIPANVRNRVAAWLRALSDGYVLADPADPHIKLTGPIIVRDLGRTELTIQTSSENPLSTNKPYHIGIDGLSLFLVLLTTFLSAVAVLSSFSAISEQVKEYMALLLLLETAMLGVFVSLDLFLFYLFWEASLIPMALLIGRWGGKRRIYASVKFILYTMAGSALMLVAALVVYTWGGTSDLPTLLNTLDLPVSLQ